MYAKMLPDIHLIACHIIVLNLGNYRFKLNKYRIVKEIFLLAKKSCNSNKQFLHY